MTRMVITYKAPFSAVKVAPVFALFFGFNVLLGITGWPSVSLYIPYVRLVRGELDYLDPIIFVS
jgi:hypothetical protein